MLATEYSAKVPFKWLLHSITVDELSYILPCSGIYYINRSLSVSEAGLDGLMYDWVLFSHDYHVCQTCSVIPIAN